MSIMIQNCRACDKELGGYQGYRYLVCQTCGSANLLSDRSAEEDNQAYFETVHAACAQNHRQPLQNRVELFAKYQHLHSRLHRREEGRFVSLLDEIVKKIVHASKVVEIGFGSGSELKRFLDMGADIYGIDLSEEAVEGFKMRFPESAWRVSCGSTFNFEVEAVYANALFEHLDAPGDFLATVSGMLKPNGMLALRLPVMINRQKGVARYEHDINFWAPCHRILYTVSGLKTRLERSGFAIVASAPLAYYGYKVMNCMLSAGYRDIQEVRNPAYPIRGLDSDRWFHLLLMRALFRKTLCADFALLARKKA